MTRGQAKRKIAGWLRAPGCRGAAIQVVSTPGECLARWLLAGFGFKYSPEFFLWFRFCSWQTLSDVKKENDQHLKNVKTAFYPWAVKAASSLVIWVLTALVSRLIYTLLKWKAVIWQKSWLLGFSERSKTLSRGWRAVPSGCSHLLFQPQCPYIIIPGAETEQAVSVHLSASSCFATQPLTSSDLSSYPRHSSYFPSPSLCIAFDWGLWLDGVPGLIRWARCIIFLLIQVSWSWIPSYWSQAIYFKVPIPACKHTKKPLQLPGRCGYSGMPRLTATVMGLRFPWANENKWQSHQEICFKNCSLQPWDYFFYFNVRKDVATYLFALFFNKTLQGGSIV